MNTVPAIRLPDLIRLKGVWTGTGHAQYPTIQPADYREELVFTANDKDPVLHYEQRTWRAMAGSQASEPLFWESGFLIDRGEGNFELVSAQRSGRVEVLRGKAVAEARNVIVIALSSVSIVNDERMLRSARTLRISPDALEYELEMATKTNPTMDTHLSARLTRASET